MWPCKISFLQEHDKVNNACGKQGKIKVGRKKREGSVKGGQEVMRETETEEWRFRCAVCGEVREAQLKDSIKTHAHCGLTWSCVASRCSNVNMAYRIEEL